MIRRLRERGRLLALELLDGREPVVVDERANFFGVESAGGRQWRGNGCLAASDEAIAFALWLPRRTLRIDRSRLVAADTTHSHLGKTVGRPLLRIGFETDRGDSDVAAWYVADLDRWLAALS